MIHVTSPIRRPAGGLRKPSLDTKNKTRPKTPYSLPKDLVSASLQAKLLELDDVNQQDVVTEEILSSLQDKSLSSSECLKMFLRTSWKDRHQKPLIAKVFHTVTQESDADFASLIETQCNNLLNVLTLLGKPDINDLGLVTLLVNLYHIEDLPDEHKAGIEEYLVDIAKAFWPYFLPDKHARIWSDDICDAVCDVLNAVGKTLDNKCPVNMERAFNNITMLLFASSSTISSYTLLRFLELKEFRASKWSLTKSAKSYYKSAYLKHPRRSSSSSPEKSDSPESCYDEDINDIKSATYSSASDSPRSCSDSDVSNTSNDGKLYSSPTRSDSPSSIDDEVFNSPENTPSTTEPPVNDNSYLIKDSNYEVIIRKNTLDNGSKTAVVRVKELSTEDKSSTVANLDSINQDFSTGSTDSLRDFEKSNSSLVHPEEAAQSTDLAIERDHPAQALIESENFETFPKSSGCLAQQPDISSCTNWEEDSLPSKIPFSGGFGLPGQQQFHGVSVPGQNGHPRGGFPRTFRRAQSENGDLKSSNFGSEGQFINTGGFQKRNGFFRRAQSENNSSYSNEQFVNSGGFSRPNATTLQRTLSESDGSHVYDNEGQFQHQYQRRSSYERYHWRSMLEFPVQEISGEDNDVSSRLYLLSFAVQPASLERPSDLTLESELDEKVWLKDFVLRKPVTVLDRFGSSS